MKTSIQIFSTILGISSVISIIFIFSDIKARNTFIEKPIVKTEIQAVAPVGNKDGHNAESESQTMKILEDDPRYWVNYLNKTVDLQDENIIDNQNVVYQMQTNPNFWIDLLKQAEK